jgi:nitrogen-specific signal transduction histidine kinase
VPDTELMQMVGEIGIKVGQFIERKETEAALQERDLAKLSAERANQAKSEFLSRMSHELRTPLNAVLGFAQLLEMEALSSEQQEHVQHILKGGRHLLTLINEVLDIARIEAGRMTLSLEPVSVSSVLGEAVDLIRPQAAGRNIQLVMQSPWKETIYVRADRQRMKQVLLNLLSNAVKYNREGGTLTVSCEAAPDSRCRLTVTDTGGGIPPALMSRLFTPFDRLGADATTEGTGLGLVLSRSLTMGMGGTLSVDSMEGRGTSASVDLPLSEPPAARVTAMVSDTVQGAAPVPGGTFTILYVEDNLPNYQLVERLVAKRRGVKLIGAMQGKLGVELAVAHRPDVILLDLNLPDIQGDEVLLRLREHPETAAIPVVMLSADAMQGQVDKLLAAGAQKYLTKPIEVAQFYALLDELMTKKGGR